MSSRVNALERNAVSPDWDSDCRFCDLARASSAHQIFGSVTVLEDAFPVTPGHHLVLPRRHVPDYFGMTSEEKKDSDRAITSLRSTLLGADPSIAGFNIGTNAGEAAGQTVPHAHIHVIPRRYGDTPSPRGGVRGVIPDRMQY
jgi:diadenosine tetraphosphate (Ap4A) HIT family hydrolase